MRKIGIHSTNRLTVLKKKVLSVTMIYIQELTFFPEIYQTIPPKRTHTKKNCKTRFNYGFSKIYSD